MGKVIVTIEQVKEQAVRLKEYLSNMKTVYDCIDWEPYGYDECDTKVIVDGKEMTVASILFKMYGGDYKKLQDANIKIQQVTVVDRDCCDVFKFGVCGATYNRLTDEFVFDVGDVNYSHTENILENVTIDNVEKEFKKAVDLINKQ